MKKRKILCNKEQPTEHSTVQSNDTCICDVGIHAVLAIGFCVFFAYNISQAANKKQEQQEPPNDVICFRNIQ